MGNILSVYIDNEKARICEATKSGGNVIVKNAFEAELPSGSVEEGMIHDVEAVAEALSIAFTNNNMKRGKIAFIISSKKIAQKEVVIPYVKNAAKIDEIINANIDEYFPMNNLEDYTYRHTVLDTFENAEGKRSSVLVTAVQKQMVEGYYQVAALMKMPVQTVDFYGNSIYQILKRQLNQGTVLAIQMDRNVTYVSIMKEKAQLFKRSIPYGKDTIVRNLADLKGISEAEAEKILADPNLLDKNVTPEEYREIIRDFSASVTRVAEFHTSRNPGTVIEVVRLMGAGVNLIGFADVLGKDLGIEVTVLKELNGLKISKNNPNGLNYENLVDYLPNVGTLLTSLDLKLEEEKKVGSYVGYYVAIIISAVAVAGAIGWVLFQNHALETYKAELQAQIDSMAGAEATYKEYLTAKQNFETINAYYESTKNPTEQLYQMVVDLEAVMPESVGITDLSVSDGSVEITGISDGKDAVAKFVIELKKLPYIVNVRVADILDASTDLGGKVSTFNMSWQLVFPPEEVVAEEGGEE